METDVITLKVVNMTDIKGEQRKFVSEVKKEFNVSFIITVDNGKSVNELITHHIERLVGISVIKSNKIHSLIR